MRSGMGFEGAEGLACIVFFNGCRYDEYDRDDLVLANLWFFW